MKDIKFYREAIEEYLKELERYRERKEKLRPKSKSLKGEKDKSRLIIQLTPFQNWIFVIFKPPALLLRP